MYYRLMSFAAASTAWDPKFVLRQCDDGPLVRENGQHVRTFDTIRDAVEWVRDHGESDSFVEWDFKL